MKNVQITLFFMKNNLKLYYLYEKKIVLYFNINFYGN